jgi:hypothetical protein
MPAALPLLLCGCGLIPERPDALTPAWLWGRPRLANRDAVARCLPADVRLDMPLQWSDSADTVENALVRVGAHVFPDGKLRSAAGKEIYFELVGSGGPVPIPLSPQAIEAEAQRHRALEERYTIIRIVFLAC